MTEKKILQKNNIPSGTLYNILLNHVHEAIYFVDLKKRITFWNHGAEKITGYNHSEIQGRICPANILLQVNDKKMTICHENCPIEKTFRDGNIRDIPAFLLHKEGYRIPVTMHTFPIRDKFKEITGGVALFSESSPTVTMPHKQPDLARMGMYDTLTGVGNKTYIEMQLKSRFAEIRKYSLPMGVILIDIDNFKKFNEVHGRFNGDKILKAVSNTLSNNLRFFDVLGRWKEDKFVVSALNLTETILDLVANKLRLLVSQSNVRIHDKLVSVTVSIGATLARPLDKPETLLKRAETLVRYSKWKGKNRVSQRITDSTFKE